MFIDESGFATGMTRRYGRSPRGRRLVAAVPHGHWQTSTLIAGLRHDGIVAPLVIDHPMNGTTFAAYVEQFLAPTLSPGDVVVLDNLSCHKNAAARQAIEAKGATLRPLPAYSPDFNPIEQVFSKLKSHVRKIAPRTMEALWTTIGQGLDAFPKTECANYLANSGYPRLM